MKVREIIALPIFHSLTVLAGHNGLSREVEYVDVVEVPDIAEKWLVPNTFLLSTTFAFREYDEQRMIDVFSAMVNSNVAAIALKLGRFVPQLPQAVVDLADSSGFPIIVLPMDFAYPKAIKELLGNIISREEQLKLYKNKQALLLYVLNSDYVDENMINPDILDIDMQQKIRIVVIDCNSTGKVPVVQDMAESLLRQQPVDHITFSAGKKVIVFLYRKKSLKRYGITKDEQDSPLRDLPDTLIGIGSWHFFENAKAGYMEALLALRLASAMGYESGAFTYDSHEFYAKMFMNNNNKENLLQAAQKVLEPVRRYDGENHTDYYGTLKAFCETGFSRKQTLEKLHIHRNTLLYRLNIIKKLISDGVLSETDVWYKVRTAIIVKNFYENDFE